MQAQSNTLNVISEISVTFTPTIHPSQFPTVSSTEEAHELFRSNWNTGTFYLQEEMKAMFLDHGNRVMGILTVCIGSKTGCCCDVPKLLGAALKASCKNIILAHNHPSGTLKASRQDISLTEKINKACQLLDIQLMDHLILGDFGFLSMAVEGYLR